MEAKKGWWIPVVTGIMVAVISGYASFLFGQSTMKSKVLRDQRALAYVQLVNNKAIMRNFETLYKNGIIEDYEKNEEYNRAQSLYRSAQYRALIFGSKELAQLLAKYRKTGEEKEVTIKLFQAMRHDLLASGDHVDDAVVRDALY